MPGAIIRSVELQQRVSGHPLDDIIVKASNADGSPATLEIQAKRTLTFTASDSEFRQVVGQIWEAAQRPDFQATRYQLAAAIARTTTRVEFACQEVLQWARELPNGAIFAAHIGRSRFASDHMRDFVAVFRANLALAGAPTDDDTVWRLLSRFQILGFDFESPGSDYENRARERARWVLAPEQAGRAADLWPVLLDITGECAKAAGAKQRPEIVTRLEQDHGFRFVEHPDVRPVYERLAEAADRALDDINEAVGGVRLARNTLVDEAYSSLEQHGVVHITGAPGVGKSSVMKHLARRLQSEGRIVVLRNGRIIPGGWLPMAHMIGWLGSQADLFNELGCGGGATLFIDNIDQIDDLGDWATVSDLLLQVARSPGWRAVVTGGLGSDDWKARIAGPVRMMGIATLAVGALSDEEKAELSEENEALAAILTRNHPAKAIAENLFYLSRMIELGVGQAAGIATELDLARLWWRYGGGRSEDDRRFARLRLLRAMGSQVLSHPSRSAFNADDLDSDTVVELLRLDSVREDIRGATVAFRHDVLRDWTIGFQLHEDSSPLDRLPMEKPLPESLARGLEIAARLALADDPTGKRWLAFLATVEREGCHGSWKRPVLLALPRAENSLTLFVTLTAVLLESEGRRLREIIRLMIAVESEPLAKMIARVKPDITVPTGAGDLIVPKGPDWMSLVLWLVAQPTLLPTALIPDIGKVFQAWLIGTQNQSVPFNADIVNMLFEWLALIDEEMAPRVYRSIREVPASLNIDHLHDVRNEIRMTVFSFAHLNPAAAARYLRNLGPDSPGYREMQTMLRWPGKLPEAAPAPFADLALAVFIPQEDPDAFSSRRNRHGPFELHNHLFLRAGPDQGPFLSLLRASPVDGLRLVRGLVEHATIWWREQYQESRQAFPRLLIRFPGNEKSFEGDAAIYRWPRNPAPSTVTTSALMALEVWGHEQIEAGRPFDDVLHDVLGPDSSSLAFVAVAIDLALSHWRLAANTVWPMVATPRLLQLDHDRYIHDISGVNALVRDDEGSQAVASLTARPSRRSELSDAIGRYVFQTDSSIITSVRTELERSREEIRASREIDEDPINGLNATVERALRMTYADNWEPVIGRRPDGSEIAARRFKPEVEEERLRDQHAVRADAGLQNQNLRIKIQAALFDPEKSTPELLREAIKWAKGHLPIPASIPDDDADNFEKEWGRRAVVMAAALVARDYEDRDREEILDWARPTLQAAAEHGDKEYTGNSQIEYNSKAIATLGLVALYLRDRDVDARHRLKFGAVRTPLCPGGHRSRLSKPSQT